MWILQEMKIVSDSTKGQKPEHLWESLDTLHTYNISKPM